MVGVTALLVGICPDKVFEVSLEMTSNNKQRILGYDALKAFAAFLVVLYHVGLVDFGYQEGVYYYPTLAQEIWLVCACGVPLFFMVNGALTVHRKYDLKKTATKSARLVFVGIFWAIVVMCLYALRDHNMSSFSLPRIGYYWFLFSLAFIYLINYLICRLPYWCRWVIVLVLLVFPFATNLAWDIVILKSPETTLTSWRHGAFTLYGLVYLYVGDYLGNVKKIGKWIPAVCAIIGLALLTIETIAVVNHTHMQFEGGNYCFPTYGALLLSIAIFLMVKDLKTTNTSFAKFMTFLGNNALGIYIFHLILMIIVGACFPSLYDMVIHPVLAVLMAIGYTIASAFLSEWIRCSHVSFLLKL